MAQACDQLAAEPTPPRKETSSWSEVMERQDGRHVENVTNLNVSSGVLVGLTMTGSEKLRAKAKELLNEAKAAEDTSDSLVRLLHSLECEKEADALEQDEVPAPRRKNICDCLSSSGRRQNFDAATNN